MPFVRNPFKKNDENVRPPLAVQPSDRSPSRDGAKSEDLDDKRPVEYQLSEINDSGVYLPPSPAEKKSFWGTASSRSTTSSSLHRCAFNENEPFNISRESFDSYRRSFDISARSPVIQPLEGRQRASLDSRSFPASPRPSNSFQRPVQVPQTQEEDKFEDVNIDDPKPAPQKKKGIFARMLDSNDDSESNGRPVSSQEKMEKTPWHHLTSRKRGQSGQGAELGAVPKREATPKPEKQLETTPTAKQDVKDAKPANSQAPEIRIES